MERLTKLVTVSVRLMIVLALKSPSPTLESLNETSVRYEYDSQQPLFLPHLVDYMGKVQYSNVNPCLKLYSPGMAFCGVAARRW